MDLFVKSISTGSIERSPRFFFHTCDLRRRKYLDFYPREDQEAIEFLKDRDVSFNLTDLSKHSFLTRLKAKMSGINQTPTLILDNGTKLKGITQIRDHFV